MSEPTKAAEGAESSWKTASRERWDADYGEGDFDRLLSEAKVRDLENLRIEVVRWANERRGIRQSDLLEIYERRIFRALDSLGPWREK